MADAFFSGKDNDEQAKKEEERLLRTMNTGARSGKFGGVRPALNTPHTAPAAPVHKPAPVAHHTPAPAAPVHVVDRSPPAATPAPAPAPVATPAPAPAPVQRSEADDEAVRREEARMGNHAGKVSVFSQHAHPVHVSADTQAPPASASLFARAAQNADAAPAPVAAAPATPVQQHMLSDDSAAEMARREEERIRKQFGAGALPRPGEKTAAPGNTAQAAARPPPASDPTQPVHAPTVVSAVGPSAGVTAATNSAFEQALLAELNQARQQPRAYAAVLRQYAAQFKDKALRLDSANVSVQTKEGAAAFNEAAAALDAAPAVGAVRQSAGFSRSALDLVADHGPTGKTGDVLADGTGAAQRLVRYGTWKKRAIETVAYLPGSARDVVVLWLADDGTADRANRKTLLDGGYSVVGIASGPHTQGGRIVVVDWAEDFHEGGQAHAPSHPAAPERSFASNTVVETPKQQATLSELPDGSGFELDAGNLGARASLSVILRNGAELVINRASGSQQKYELPFAYTADRVTARFTADEHLIIKLHKPRETKSTGDVDLAAFRMVPKSLSERVQIDIKETHTHLLLTTLPSKWDEQVTVRLRDGKVLLWETKHNVEDQEGLKSVTATQSLKLPFEVSPAAVQVTVLPNDAGAVTQLIKPLAGTVGDVAIPIN